MKAMPDHEIDKKLAMSIWNHILDDLPSRDDVCQLNTLETMFSFFDMFLREHREKNTKSFILKRILRIYLKKGKPVKRAERWLLDMEIPVDIECNVPFLESDLPLLSYWPPTSRTDNFYFSAVNGESTTYIQPGPLAIAINVHPLGKSIINECRDKEGYTPLHRAAQGGNIIAVKELISWGADTTLTTLDNNLTALELAVSYSGLPKTYMEYVNLNLWQGSGDRYDPEFFGLSNGDNIAFLTSSILLSRTPNIKVVCDGSATQLTIYHIAAYRGMFDFVMKLLQNSKQFGMEVDCPDINGITPLYLAKLNVGVRFLEIGKGDPWLRTVRLIESYGGKLTNPNNFEAEFHLLYQHLYGSFSLHFDTDVFKDLFMLYKHNPLNSCFQKFESKTHWFWGSYQDCVLGIFGKFNLARISIKHNLRLQTVLLNVLSIKRNEEPLSNQLLHSSTKQRFENLDELFAIAKEISNSLMSEISYSWKHESNMCNKLKLCSRFFESLALAINYFWQEASQNYAEDNLSFYRFRLLGAELIQRRLKFLPVLSYPNITLISKKRFEVTKAMVESVRYLLDIVLKKSTKYDYLDKLVLGISPMSRLFYKNTKRGFTENDILSQRKRKAKIERLNKFQRMLFSSFRKWSSTPLTQDKSKTCIKMVRYYNCHLDY